MQILITGGCGFIGSKLATRFVTLGHEVRSLDYKAPQVATGDLLLPVEFVDGDITNSGSCHEAMRDIDVVIHSAAVHLASSVSRHPLRSIETNVCGTLNLLTSAAAADVRRFVFMSSAKVYGEPARLPSTEQDFARPYDSYSLSKMACEHYCQRFRRETDLETISIRPFSVYGPDQDLETGYVGMLVRALVEDEEPTFPGQPSFLRDFVHIDDVVEITTRAVLHDGPIPEVLNAGSGRTVSLSNLVDIASRISGRRILPTFVRPQKGTITRTQASLTAVTETLGPLHNIPADLGLEETLRSVMESAS